MAINTDNNQNPQAQQQKPTTAGTSGLQPPKIGGFGSGLFSGLNIYSKSIGSETVTKLKDKLNELFKNIDESVDVKLIPILAEENRIPFSHLVVATRINKVPNLVGIHLLVIEASGKALEATDESILSQNVKVMHTTSEVIDDRLKNIVIDNVANKYPGHNILIGGATVIPRTFNIEDINGLHLIAHHSIQSGGTKIAQSTTEFSDLNLATEFTNNNIVKNLTIGLDILTGRQNNNVFGIPVRNDVIVKFTNEPPMANKRNIISHNDPNQLSTPIVSLAGYIDLMWAPKNPMQTNPLFSSPMIPTNMSADQLQMYASKFIITDIDSAINYYPGMILLSLITSIALNENRNWISYYRPRAIRKSELDLYDIGALNIEANLKKEQGNYGSKIDIREQGIDLGYIGNLINTLVAPNISIAIDIEQGGINSWFINFLNRAASGNPADIQNIYNASQELSNGNFSKYFNLNDPIFINAEKILLGYYMADNGVKQDIRTLGYLEVMNLAHYKNQLDLIKKYSDTYAAISIPEEIRLRDRMNILQTLITSEIVITGQAIRRTFSGKFIEALARSCSDVGLAPRLTANISGTEFVSQRFGIQGVANSALGSGALGFNYSGPGTFQPRTIQNGW